MWLPFIYLFQVCLQSKNKYSFKCICGYKNLKEVVKNKQSFMCCGAIRYMSLAQKDSVSFPSAYF